MLRKSLPVCLVLAIVSPVLAQADDLTRIIQKDLIALGYDPGNIQGEATTETIVAISKFQAENDLEVTGEPSPQLAGIIKAKLKANNNPAGQAAAPAVAAEATAAGAAAPMSQQTSLQAAQQACLQEKMAQAQEQQKKKRGFGSLMRAVTRSATRFGGDAGRDIADTTYDIYTVDATAQDLDSAAKDLGLTPDELEECRNPPM